MAKKKKVLDNADEVVLFLNGKNVVFQNKGELDRKIDNGAFDPTNILEGMLKDGYCNYKFETVAGLNSGKKSSVDGKSCLVMNDMDLAFRRLRAHMAYIDDMFGISGVTILNIEDMQNHELTQRFTIHGFQIKGTGVNESVVIIGEKFVESVGDHVSWKSSKITIGENSHYKWAQNLNEVVADCREEVRLYHHGKYTKEVAEIIDPAQMTIMDTEMQAEENFEGAKV